MRHKPLVIAALVAAMTLSAAPAFGAIGNRYHDGQDLAVATAAGNNFRLDVRAGWSRTAPRPWRSVS